MFVALSIAMMSLKIELSVLAYTCFKSECHDYLTESEGEILNISSAKHV